MNRHRHRVVFNAARGLRMVVAECASARGPSTGATAATLLAGVLLTTPAWSQIVADPAAPGNQRPTILTAPNGVPLVNIQTPSPAGVSLNQFSQFDVGAPGAILNNSRTATQTQLGGGVAGNPWLATGPARIIVNQVNSHHPSHLNGPIEVAGQRAEVIVANPSGIQVNGSTFINASGVTLTTGVPVFKGGSLDSYIVQRGSVGIFGAGLDTRGADYTATAYTWGVIGEDCNPPLGCDPEYGWVPSTVNQRIPTTLRVSALRHEQHASDAPKTPSMNLGSALFQPVADPAVGFLFQTDPNFTRQRRWTDSGAQFALLALDPNTLQKRLGDGFLEQRLVREQIAQLIGQRFLGDYSNDDAQYLALLTAGATFAQAHQLRPGIVLSAEQVAALTSDIVWLEAQTVTLPDGRTVSALVPRVYLMPREGDLSPEGSLLAGRQVHLDLSGGFLNSGSVAGRDLVLIDAQGMRSSGRIASQGTTALRAQQDIEVDGGDVSAKDLLVLDAGRDILVASTSAESTDGRAVVLDRVARLHVSDEAGELIASAGQDIELKAAVAQAGVVDVHAERDLRLTTLNTREELDATQDEKNYGRVQRSAEVGSRVSGGEPPGEPGERAADQ